MTAKCPKCSRELDFTYVKKIMEQGNGKCPSCRAEVKESGATKVIVLLLAIVPIFLLANFIENFFIRVIIIFIWAFIINLGIRPAIARFSLVKK